MTAVRSAPVMSPAVLRAAGRAGVCDYLALHQWSTYLSGWLVRLLCQVVFFSAVTDLIGSGRRDFVLIGNAAAVAAIEGTMVVADIASEMQTGTQQALMATPLRVGAPLIARSAHWIGNGVVTGLLVYTTIAFTFSIPMSATAWLLLPLLLAGCAASAWAFACVIAAIVAWRPAFKWLALNVSYLSLLTFCGVNTRVDYWPSPVRALADVVPFTPALQTLRNVQRHAGPAETLAQAALTVGLTALWLAAAVLLLNRLATRARAAGSIQL